MDRLNYERKPLPAVKSCEFLISLVARAQEGKQIYIDAGVTNVGRLIAIMLGRLEMDVDECITAYTEFMRTVFEKKSSWFSASWAGNIKSQFDSVKLETAIKEVIIRHKAKETDLFDDGVKRGCRTLVSLM
jgi:hypothetical protein